MPQFGARPQKPKETLRRRIAGRGDNRKLAVLVSPNADRVRDIPDYGYVKQRAVIEIIRNENIRGLDVTVAEPLPSQEDGCPSHLINNLPDFCARYVLKPLLQFRAGRTFHQEKKPPLDLAPVVYLH